MSTAASTSRTSTSGAGGLFNFLYHHIKKNGHAEGAGQSLVPRTDAQWQREHDESGNPAFQDIDAWLKGELKA